MKHKFKLTRLWVASLLLFLGISPNLWAITVNGGTFYLDNSKTNWSQVALFVGKDGNDKYTSVYTMNKITNTKLYYYNMSSWGGATYIRYTACTGWDSGFWGPENYNCGDGFTATYTGNYTFNSNSLYLFVPASGNKDASISPSYISSYSGFNKTQTIKAKVSTDGGSNYSDVTTSPGTLSANSKKFSSYNTCETSTSLSSGKITCGYTATTTLTAADATGYTFVAWYKGSSQVSTNKSITIYPTDEDTYYAYYKENRYDITATVNDANMGSATPTTATAMGQITGGSITATENTGYHFVNWEVGTAAGTFGSSTTASTTFKPTKAGTVVANFAENTHSVTISNDGNGTTSPTGAQTVGEVTGISITATPNDGFGFKEWLVTGGTISAQSATTTFKPTADNATIQATFQSTAVYYTWGFGVYQSTGGTVESTVAAGNHVQGGTSITLTAAPATGYEVEGWYDNADCTGDKLQTGDDTYTFSISSNSVRYVKFKEKTFSVTVQAGTGIDQVTGGGANVGQLTGTAISATVKNGYTWSTWTGGTGTFAEGATVKDNTFRPTAASTLTATATENKTTVTVSSNNTTWGTVSPASANVGVTTTETLTASAKPGYKFVTWELANCVLVTGSLTNAQITIKGDGSSATGTAVATFAEDLTANWYIEGEKALLTKCTSDWQQKNANYRFSKPSKDASSAYIDIEITQAQVEAGKEYQFKLRDAGVGGEPMYGWGTNGDDHHTFIATETFEIYNSEGKDHNLRIKPSIAGTYRFSIDWSENKKRLTVTWPSVNDLHHNFTGEWTHTAGTVENGVLTANYEITQAMVDSESALEFEIIYEGVYYGPRTDKAQMTATNHTDWKLEALGHGYHVVLKPSIAGTYTFVFDSKAADKNFNVTYPVPDAPASINVTAERYFGEEKIDNFIATDPYQVYTDETIKLTIDAVAAPTGCTTYYQFGENAASTERTYTISNITNTASSIEAKVFFRPNAGGKDGDAKSETINYQGVAYPQLFLTSNLTNDETELDQAPDNVTISYMTANYTGSTTITKNGESWQTPDSEHHYTEPLTKSIHADTYVATATPNGRTFTTSLVVSVYRYVQVKVKDADPKWAKNVYMWKSGTDKKNADWPGEALTTQLGDWYIFAVKYPTYDNFVINDGQEKGNQTIDLEIPNHEICYEIGALDHEGDGRYYYNCTEAAQCPNKLFVGNIDDVEMYNGESTTVSPVVQLDPSLSEDDLQINFTYSAGGIVNATQSGKNIMLSATSTGTTTVTATYSINGAESVSKSFTVTVTGAVLIQVSITTDLGWNNKDEIHIKYFNHGLNSEKKMKWDHFYNDQDYFSARIPVGSDGKIDFMIHAWQIENEHPDHQTVDVQNVSTDGCYCVLTDQESNQKRKMREEGSLCWEEYQVKIVMGNGTTYYSNKVNNLNEIVSFYAPADNEQGYKHGNVYLTHNGVQVAAITGFTESNVYTAKVAANGLTDINVYNGPFYIRTDATSWNDYKKPDYQMNEFSLYDGAQYNYYWVGNHKNSGSFNIKGCVANQYNESLANMIEGANYTDGYGNIQNDPTFGVNLRFGYNPETNHFERSILKGSSDNEFLNVIGDNIFNEVGCTTKLNQQDANSKFSDISNWVYEKVVYAKIGESFTEAQVKLLSKAFNGTVVYQFGYTIDPNTGQKTSTPATRSIMATGTTSDTYQLRLIYDYKTNRLTAAWSPADNQQIENSITVNADIMFMQKEHNDATRLRMGDAGKVESLEYLLFILQIAKDDTRSGSNNNFEHYYISLPYDCMIQDIYGIEGFGEYWGIQKYDGAERARKGWFIEDTPEGFWKWMNRDEKLNGGEGYLLSVAKGWLKEDNKFSTIKDTDGKEISALRLYFPSYTKGYDLSQSSADELKVYEPQRCNITSPVDRRKEDSNWRMIGSTAYNDITTNTVTSSADEDHKLAANYLYDLQQVGGVWKYVAVSGVGFIYKAFQGYMYQFEGKINWQRYTKGEEENPASAPRYEAKRPAEKMRLSVMENETEVAHTFVELNENATKEFDFNLDLAYLASGDMDLYTEIENAHLAANVTDYESQMIALHVDPTHYNTYTFHLDGANNVAVYLLDNMNGTCQLLSAGDVTVELEEGSSGDRFALRFDVAASPTDSKNAKGETIINDGQKTQKLLINDNIYLINAGRVYNASGTKVR